MLSSCRGVCYREIAMSESESKRGADPREQLNTKIIAPAPTRHGRAITFQAYVLIASLGFVVMAVFAHTIGYFPIDLTFTRSIQTVSSPLFGQAMQAVSWIGFIPQVDIIGGALIVALFIAGLRWEAVCSLFAAGGTLVGSLAKLIVIRPRPTADLVNVFSQIDSSGFPSGHVLMVTTFYGFLTFLGYTLFKPSWQRTALLALFFVLIVLMGLSRIYLGHHWFSDVMGAYVLGSLWLALSI